MTTLRGMTWEHPRGYDCMVASSAEYERLTGIRIDWERRSLQAFADAPLDDLAAQFDLLVIDHPHVPQVAASGVLARLDGAGFDDQLETLARQSLGRCHKSYRYEGHQYGLATDAAAQVSARRPDLLARPPHSWEEVLELARSGRVLWPAKPIDAFSSLVTIAANRGTPPAAQAGSFLTETDALPVLDLMHRLAEAVPSDNFELNPIEVAERLATGDHWVYAPLLFGYSNYSRSGFREHRLAYSDIPSSGAGVAGSLLGGAGVAVSARSRLQQQARAFAFWSASASVQSGIYFDGGGQPGNAAAWDDDRLNATTLDFFRATRATLEGAYLRPRCPGYLAFQDLVSPWVTAALRRDLSDAQLVTRLNDAAAELLGAE
jgi:multiple sugar transport system substrate-binding protein